MASDNLLRSTTTLRTLLTSTRKKLSKIKTEIDNFDLELDQINVKLDAVVAQAEVYRTRVEREALREVKRLEREIASLTKTTTSKPDAPSVSDGDRKVATTIGIFECLIRLISGNSDDFRLATQSFLFPAVYERVMEGEEEAYFLDRIPDSAEIVVKRGRELLEWLRDEYQTHLTEEGIWEDATSYITEWWRNDALPLLYGARDEQWDIDVPLTLTEMTLWSDYVSERELNFPRVSDALNIYRKFKDEIYGSSNIRTFESKYFTFETAQAAQ